MPLSTEGKGGVAKSSRRESYLIQGLNKGPWLLLPWCGLQPSGGEGIVGV